MKRFRGIKRRIIYLQINYLNNDLYSFHNKSNFGKGNHNIGKTELEKHFPKEKFKIEVDYSNYKKHAISLTKKR